MNMNARPCVTNGNPLIRCEHVTIAYGRQEVVHDVCLDIPPGILLPFVGPNGAGKTTLLRAILGLLPLARGAIHTPFAGKPAGYVPQQKAIDPLYPVTTRQIVEMGLYCPVGTGRLRHCRRAGGRAVTAGRRPDAHAGGGGPAGGAAGESPGAAGRGVGCSLRRRLQPERAARVAERAGAARGQGAAVRRSDSHGLLLPCRAGLRRAAAEPTTRAGAAIGRAHFRHSDAGRTWHILCRRPADQPDPLRNRLRPARADSFRSRSAGGGSDECRPVCGVYGAGGDGAGWVRRQRLDGVVGTDFRRRQLQFDAGAW
ncbi:MAG: ATP-binding cassette domain-containing protein, partial [Planctomycetes bacterium]|nr:ATP-binding cassette domain-containing protein [Planctomycetota bacterium]